MPVASLVPPPRPPGPLLLFSARLPVPEGLAYLCAAVTAVTEFKSGSELDQNPTHCPAAAVSRARIRNRCSHSSDSEHGVDGSRVPARPSAAGGGGKHEHKQYFHCSPGSEWPLRLSLFKIAACRETSKSSPSPPRPASPRGAVPGHRRRSPENTGAHAEWQRCWRAVIRYVLAAEGYHGTVPAIRRV